MVQLGLGIISEAEPPSVRSPHAALGGLRRKEASFAARDAMTPQAEWSEGASKIFDRKIWAGQQNPFGTQGRTGEAERGGAGRDLERERP